MKVHKVELLIVDHDGLGADEITAVIENQKYPNWCIYPEVMAVRTVEVDWSDAHPLNRTDESKEREYLRLFPSQAGE